MHFNSIIPLRFIEWSGGVWVSAWFLLLNSFVNYKMCRPPVTTVTRKPTIIKTIHSCSYLNITVKPYFYLKLSFQSCLNQHYKIKYEFNLTKLQACWAELFFRKVRKKLNWDEMGRNGTVLALCSFWSVYCLLLQVCPSSPSRVFQLPTYNSAQSKHELGGKNGNFIRSFISLTSERQLCWI